MLSHIQGVRATSPYEISAPDLPGLVNQHIMLTFAQDQAANHPSLNGIEGNTIKTQKAIGTSIIADRASWPELRAGFTFLALGGFDSLKSLRTSTYSELSAQFEMSTSLPIDTMVSRVRVGDMLMPAKRSNPRSCFVKTLLRLSQSGFMFTYIQFDTDSPYEHILHKKSIAEPRTKVKKGDAAFLPRLKPVGILPQRFMKQDTLQPCTILPH